MKQSLRIDEFFASAKCRFADEVTCTNVADGVAKVLAEMMGG